MTIHTGDVCIAIHWLCPKVGCDGKMYSSSEYHTINPPAYFHTCNKCKHTVALAGGRRFPEVIVSGKPPRVLPL